MEFKKLGKIFTCTVTSDGTKGRDWVIRLRNSGFHLTKSAIKTLEGPNFEESCGVTYNIALVPLSLLGPSYEIRGETTQKNAGIALKTPPSLEIACLIRGVVDEFMKENDITEIVVLHSSGQAIIILNFNNMLTSEYKPEPPTEYLGGVYYLFIF